MLSGALSPRLGMEGFVVRAEVEVTFSFGMMDGFLHQFPQGFPANPADSELQSGR